MTKNYCSNFHCGEAPKWSYHNGNHHGEEHICQLGQLVCLYGSSYQVPRTGESRAKEEGKIVELECTAHSKARALIAELESTIRFLEEQNIAERQECHSATMQLRRSERRVRLLTLQLEEEKRNVENQKDIAEKHSLRVKQMRRELDEQEEELTRERAKSRNLQRKIDELTRANEMLTRENNTLRARAENRENMRLYQILRSSDNLSRNHAEEDGAGNEATISDRSCEPMVTSV
ncbi:hypothetical protein Aduo_017902 [Ancylostoma duodenale]